MLLPATGRCEGCERAADVDRIIGGTAIGGWWARKMMPPSFYALMEAITSQEQVVLSGKA